tara:strand:+ start:873 stop:1640 length:768 start_codon:yes stop_codon:yes gene_type:complete
MLSFVGLGLYDIKSITRRGEDAVREADFVFLENYTSELRGSNVRELEEYYGKAIEILQREDVEVNPEQILECAKKGKTAILIAGDPMISTTHIDLRLRANELHIETEIIHGTSSITAACGLTGLQNYRFGKSTTIPFEPENKVPDSIIRTIIENKERGLHTLVYLDIKIAEGRYMTGGEAAEKLIQNQDHEDINMREEVGVVVARAGSQNPYVVLGKLKHLAKMDFGNPLHLMIIPGELHHMEMEAMQSFANLIL